LNDDESYVQKIYQLLDLVDSAIKEPPSRNTEPFLMPVESVFSLSGRGTVCTGRVERGQLKLGEAVDILGFHPAVQKTTVAGIEMFHKLMDDCRTGDNVGLLVKNVKKDQIQRGHCIVKSGTAQPSRRFKCTAYFLTKDEGGRHTPFSSDYEPIFYFRTASIPGHLWFPEEGELKWENVAKTGGARSALLTQKDGERTMVLPGDTREMYVELRTPLAIEKQLTFAMREGGRTIGAGVVLETFPEKF